MQSPPPKRRQVQDDWGTGAREGYEDRGAFRPLRVKKAERGSPLLRTLGGLAMVAGICWGTWIATQGPDWATALQQNHGPVAIVAIGLVGMIVGKYIKA